MSEPIFEPNEEPLDENRVEEGLDDPDLPLEETVPVPEDEDTGVYGGGQMGVPRPPGDLASDVEPVPHDPQQDGPGPAAGNTPV